MILRDAAQQALEALRIAQDDCIHGEMAEPSPIFEKAITALEAALAEPQPEPVAWLVTTEMQDGTRRTYPMTGRLKDAKDACDFGDPAPLYTAPPQRQHAEIVRLKAERDALLADAERYRYLRNRKKDEVFSKSGPDAGCWIDCEDEQQDLVLLTGDDADAAIDAARGKT